MATTTVESPVTELPTFKDKVADTIRHAADAARHASSFKASDAVAESVAAAKRTIEQTVHELEGLRDTTANRVKQAPFTAIGLALGSGILLGVVFGWFGGRRKA